MLAEKGIDPQKRSKLGLSPVVIEPEPKFLSELNISNKFTPDASERKHDRFSSSGGRRNTPGTGTGSRPNTMERRRQEAEEVRQAGGRAVATTSSCRFLLSFRRPVVLS